MFFFKFIKSLRQMLYCLYLVQLFSFNRCLVNILNDEEKVEFLVWSLMFACVMSHVTNASCCGGPIPKYTWLYSSEVCSCSHGTPCITRAGDLTAHFQEITCDSGTFCFVDVCCLLFMVPKVIPKDLIIFLLARRAKRMEDCIRDFLQMD